MEALRQDALANTPSFVGGGKADRSPVKQEAGRARVGQVGSAPDDAEDSARKQQRAHRFKATMQQAARQLDPAPRERSPDRDSAMGGESCSSNEQSVACS